MILEKLGYTLYGTPGTAKYYEEHYQLILKVVTKPETEDDDGEGTALEAIKSREIDMVINISEGTNLRDEITGGYIIRRAAVDFDVSLITNVKCAIQVAECLDRGAEKFLPRHIGEFYNMPTIGWQDLKKA